MKDGARDHGGDLDRAIARFGAGRWLDLSTGINPQPYPVSAMDGAAWSCLPARTEIDALEAAAASAYGTSARVVALAGAQAAIQLVPRLAAPGCASVVGPTYNEHAAALEAQGWKVRIVSDPAKGATSDLLTVVNPNNPDGRRWQPEALHALKDQVGLLVVDESFADTEPESSMAPLLGANNNNVMLLRSFGKFFGLAGLRLGFALTGEGLAKELRGLAGPWAVSGPAISVGKQALSDATWQANTRRRLKKDAVRLDAMAAAAGWRSVGGTDLFRTYETKDAKSAQARLAEGKVWSRVFPYSETWLRLGLPGSEADWAKLADAVSGL